MRSGMGLSDSQVKDAYRIFTQPEAWTVSPARSSAIPARPRTDGPRPAPLTARAADPAHIRQRTPGH